MTIHQEVVKRNNISSEKESIESFVNRVTQKATDIKTDYVEVGNPKQKVAYPRNDINIIGISYMNEDIAVIAYTSN